MMEHDLEPVPGLPARLPRDERVLWQGAPSWPALAVHAFHVRVVGVYFAALAIWSVISAVYDGRTATQAFAFAIWPLVMGVIAVGLVFLLARAVARTTAYTVTSKRLVLRVGVAFSVTVNLPFAVVEAIDLRRHADGSGDILIRTAMPHRLSYWALFPHVQLWRLLWPRAVLRALADPKPAADALAMALTGEAASPAPQAASAPEGVPPLVPATT